MHTFESGKGATSLALLMLLSGCVGGGDQFKQTRRLNVDVIVVPVDTGGCEIKVLSTETSDRGTNRINVDEVDIGLPGAN